MGVRHIMADSRPTWCCPASTAGRNAAEDVTYSGTIAGAKEAAMLGVPSFALSQALCVGDSGRSRTGRRRSSTAPDIIRRVLKEGIPRDVLVNINFPDCPPGAVKGIAVATQGKRDQELLHIDAAPRRARQSVLLARVRARRAADRRDGTDLSALADNRISVTPLRLDLTDEPFMTKLAAVFK